MKLPCAILFLLAAHITMSSQDHSPPYRIKGKVTDKEGDPVSSANVFIKGTTQGTMSAMDGTYFLEVNNFGFDTLLISHIGYKTRAIALRPKAETKEIELDIILARKVTFLQDVEVLASTFTSGDRKGVTLSSLEVVKTPGASGDIMWAIQTFPGVQQVEEGAGLFVRGGDVSETVFIIDGAYLYHPYKFESPNGGYFGTIPPFLLKDIYFSCGGYGVEYTNSISGALVMETHDVAPQKKGYLSLGLANSGVKYQLPILQDKLSASFSANYSNTRPLFWLNGKNKDFSNSPVTYDLNFNSTYKYAKGIIKLFLFRESDKLGVYVNDPQNPAYYEGKNASNLANVSFQHAIDEKMLLKGNIALSSYHQNAALANKNIHVKNILTQTSLSANYSFNNKLRSEIGIDILNNNEQVRGDLTFTDNGIDSTFILNVDYHSYKVGLYNKWKYYFTNKLVTTVGLRYERESLTKENVIDLRGSFSWNFIGDWSLVSSVGQYHQYGDPEYFDKYYGNPYLGSFEAVHYILGLVHENEKNLFRIEFYYKDYKRLLLKDPEVNYTNAGYGYARGIDIFYKREWKKINGRVSLSLLDTKRKWSDAPFLAPTKFDITCTFTSVVEYAFHEKFSIGTKYRYATGSPYSSAPTTYNDKRLPDYHTLDVSFNYMHSFFKDNLTVFYIACNNILGIDNILGYKFSQDYSVKMPVKSSMLRSIYFGLQFSF